jgi:hypothetical protein
MSIEVTFWATVAQVRTLADGGIRVMMDLSEDAIMQAAQLMECKRAEVVLKVMIQVDDKSGKSRKIQI